MKLRCKPLYRVAMPAEFDWVMDDGHGYTLIRVSAAPKVYEFTTELMEDTEHIRLSESNGFVYVYISSFELECLGAGIGIDDYIVHRLEQAIQEQIMKEKEAHRGIEESHFDETRRSRSLDI